MKDGVLMIIHIYAKVSFKPFYSKGLYIIILLYSNIELTFDMVTV